MSLAAHKGPARGRRPERPLLGVELSERTLLPGDGNDSARRVSQTGSNIPHFGHTLDYRVTGDVDFALMGDTRR